LIKEIIVELNSKGGFGLRRFAREEGGGTASLKKFTWIIDCHPIVIDFDWMSDLRIEW
jgi:hypothetical protein